MKANKISEFKEIVLASGYEFKCDYRHLKKLTVKELSRMWGELLKREASENGVYSCVESHDIGGWVGISLTFGDKSNIGISESVQKRFIPMV